MGSSKLGSRSTADDVLRGVSLEGRTMLVTGANSGIGFETARSLAAAHARVLIACRNAAKGAESAAKIVAQHPHAKVTAVELDLASFKSVRRAAAELPADKLDALICNAGLFANDYQTTEDGIESTVGVCHFGHFLLAQLVKPRLRAAERARVVMVSSESHRYPSRLKLERFPLEARSYKPLVAYGQAKLCNVLFANELSRRWAAEGITANSLHPGSFIGTDIFRSTVAGKAISVLISPFTKSIAQGAATTVYCAASPELEGIGGRYFADCREKPMSAGARDADVAARLWTLSEERVSVARLDG
jgi:WW domain-containing oxidoreductase